VWVNQAPAAVPTTLGALTDVATSTPVDGQVLTFDTASSQWANKTLPGYTKTEVDTKLETLATGLAHGESVNSITATPPSAPVEGDLVIVATGATGAFSGHVNSLALWHGGNWVFTPPEANETHLVEDQDALFHWNGTTWVKIASTTAATGSTAKRGVGEIIPWLADTVPDGYLECKGQAVAISAYPDLYAVLGNKYNAGTGADGTTTFSLPDLRGYFLRGTGANGGEVNVGVVQSDTTRLPRTAFTTSTAGSHSHWNGKKEYVDDPNVFAYGKKSLNTYGWVGSNTDGFNQGVAATSTDGAHTHTIGGGDAETRPKSVSVKWIIRTVAINGGAQGPKGEKGDSAYSVTLMAMIGDIKQSVLTETQFKNALPAAERSKWVLADGRNVAGTAYASATGRNTIPDLRGAYLRMAGQNNNAGWNGGTLNDWQEDTTRRPRNTAFTTDSQGNHGHNFGNDSMLVTASWGGGHDLAVGPGGNPEGLQTFHHDGAHTHTINGGGDTETRPKTYSVNYFIKVDN
jgi:microcystin-dependent protein